MLAGGVCASGENMHTISEITAMHSALRHIQESLEKQLPILFPVLKYQGYKGEPELKCVLQFNDFGGALAFFPDYLLQCNFTRA
jgi:hypothetical protein